MATYYSGLTNQRDALPLLPDQKHTSFQSSGLPGGVMFLNHPSTPLAYPELSPNNNAEVQSIRGGDEMLILSPTSDLLNMQPVGSLLNGNSASMEANAFSSKPFDMQNVEQNLQYQGLSLSLAMEVPSYHDQYRNSGLSSLLTTHAVHSDQGSQYNENKNVEYLSFDLAGAHQNSVKVGAIDNLESSIGLREVNFSTHLHEAAAASATIYNSKYLKAAQDLLDEVVNVQSAKKQSDKQNLYSFVQNGSDEAEVKSSCSGPGMASDLQKSTDISSAELSATERYDLESKMTKLFSLLDKVDISYKQYYEHMQVLVSSFEMVAGLGAARPYTALALKTISCQFRCLCDAIKKQIQVTRQSLGEQGNSQGERLYRLRHVDQQLRQQRLLQQFGVMRQPWRPLRGLPENAVSILRAWLFEHFLHPYPKDSEKVTLARQTGLTRSQVANWFINARVRLWKPMIEEMYKEEVGDTEAGSTASPEQIPAAATENSASEDTADKELQESLTSAAGDYSCIQQYSDVRTNNVPDHLLDASRS